MQELLPEHLLLVARELDGDSYFALSQVSRHFHHKLNAKSFLACITEGFPFLVADSSFFAYCYSQYYLTSRSVPRVYKTLKRTLQAEKMTEQSWTTLKKCIVKLMIDVIESEDSEAEIELSEIRRRLHGTSIAVEIHDFQALYAHTVYIHNPKRTPEQKEIKKGRLPEQLNDPKACLRTAVHYQRHEIIFTLLERYGAQLGRIDRYLCLNPDTIALRALLAALPVEVDHLLNYAEIACGDDDPELLEVFCNYLQPRATPLQFFTFLQNCMIHVAQNDLVRCFDYLLHTREKGINIFLKHALFRYRAYRIIKYYELQPSWTDRVLSILS